MARGCHGEFLYGKSAVAVSVATFLCSTFLILFDTSASHAQTWDERKAATLPKGVIADLTVRERYEFVDWYGAPGVDSSYSFGHSKTQFGLGYQTESWKAYVQGQNFQLWNLPEGSTGPGSVFFAANEGDEDPGGTYLRQVYLELKDHWAQGFSGQIGRFLYSGGLEVSHTDPTLSWLKNKRVGHRLIGPFDFTGGRSFDGVRGDLKTGDTGTLTLHASHPTQGGFETNGSDTIEDISLVTAAWTSRLQEKREFQGFYYFYGDERNVVKADNRPEAVRLADFQDINIHTLGGHYVSVWDTGPNAIDALIWGAFQAGEWGSQDHLAGSIAVEGGYRFQEMPGKPWIRGGYNYGSGDDDPDDSDHTTFFQMLPTVRVYAQTPFFNQMNTQDLFAQVLVDPVKDFTIRSDARVLWLTSDDDALYSGAGAAEARSRFGYAAAPSGGDSYVGTLLDIELSYKFNPNITGTIYYGHLFGGDVVENFTSGGDENIDYAFVELSFRL